MWDTAGQLGSEPVVREFNREKEWERKGVHWGVLLQTTEGHTDKGASVSPGLGVQGLLLGGGDGGYSGFGGCVIGSCIHSDWL